MSFQQYILDATVNHLRASLMEHMPEGTQRDFYLWGISDTNPNRSEFLQLVGMNQVNNLAAHILEPIVKLEDWPKVAAYCGALHSYFLYELVSDDLAANLSLVPRRSKVLDTRIDLLHGFNGAMVKRLSGVNTPSSEMLDFIKPIASTISGSNQQPARDKYTNQVEQFLKAQGETSSTGFDLWSILVANIESCNALIMSTESLYINPIIRQGFINRYASVSASLDAHINMGLDELLNIGVHTVSVIPVLAYMIGVMTEILDPDPAIREVIDDGTLDDALVTTATIIRLLNDLGVVATYPTSKRASLIHSLWKAYESRPAHVQTMMQLLCHVAKKNDALTRLQKDMLYGEFNVCLHNLALGESIEYGISVFGANLDYFVQVYRQSAMHLRDVLALLDRRLKNKTVSHLIWGFINFHERIYTHRFDTAAGEYVA